MVMDTQTQLGFQKTGQELKALHVARSTPSYAPTLAADLKNDFDPTTGIYNLKTSNMKRHNNAVAKVLNGTGKCNTLFLGDSSLIGYNGSVVKEAAMIPRLFGEAFATRVGIRSAGGAVPSVTATSFSTDKFTVNAGTVDIATYVGTFTLNAGAAVTWAPTQLGTEVHFLVSNLSTNNFTYQIDGGSAVAVTTNATATWKLVSVTGLAYGSHTLRINCPGAGGSFVFFGLVMVTNPIGYAVHNIALGGSRASFGTVNQAWTNTGAGGPYGNRKQAFDVFGITPDLVVCSLGANDISSGDTPANAITGLTTIRNWYPNSDFMLMHTAGFSGGTIATYDTYSRLKYMLADALDCPLMDIRVRMGDSAEALANGLLGADNAHAIDGVGMQIGRVMATALARANGMDAMDTPIIKSVPTGTTGFAGLPDGSVWIEYTP
jgi:hypothetical protein